MLIATGLPSYLVWVIFIMELKCNALYFENKHIPQAYIDIDDVLEVTPDNYLLYKNRMRDQKASDDIRIISLEYNITKGILKITQRYLYNGNKH